MSDNVVGTVGATVNTDGIVGGTVAIAGGGGTSNYNDLINKPSINGVTLSGNKTLSDLGAASLADVAQSVDDALQEAKDSGEFDGPPGPRGESGATGPQGPAGVGVPAGGSTGQVLAKRSGTDYDTEWVNQSGGGGGGAVDDVKVNGNTVVIDGVANVPLADTINPGVVRIPSGANASIDIHNGTISVRTATPDAIKYGTNDLPIGVNVAKETAFYGLASAAGDTSQKQSVNPVGTYTNGAKQAIKTMLGINDTTSYNTLTNKPSINGVTLSGNKTLSDLGAASAADVTAKYTKPSGGIPASDLASAVQTSLDKADTALQTAPVASVAGKTGAVTLDAGDVEYDDTDTYAAGTVGAGMAELKSEVGDLSDLTTTAKTNLVAAINEAAQSGGGTVDLYYVTPEQYGAVGDGVTDDSQAVQDACDAGYAVYFDSGKTYYLASTVTIDHDCHLFGGEGATIKTKTPTGGAAPNGIVVAGSLKKTTTLTSDYASTGAGDNSGNQWTLTDMTGIEIGDILIVTATDQYYNYSRQYYYLGATLLIGDIYNGHLYTTDSMPWDITNTANVTVQVYSAPTAIIEGLHFVSDLDSRGNYINLLSLSYNKNTVIRNCNFTQMDIGVMLRHTVNVSVDCVTVSKSKWDNSLTGDGYGIYLYSCSNTEITRVMAICAQGCIDMGGQIPNLNTYIHNCNLASECRAIGIDLHENSYNLVVEDCTLAGLSLYGTATINRCRFIKSNRVSGETAIIMRGSHDPRWAQYKISDCVIDLKSSGGLYVQADHPIQQTGIQSIDNIIGCIEISNCTGGQFIYRPTTDSTILSNTIQRLVMHNWRDCYNVYLNGSTVDYAEIIDCTFIPANGIWLNTNGAFGFAGIETLVQRGNYPQIDKLYANVPTTGINYYLPQGTPITFASSDTSAHYQVCGKNVISNDVSDINVGNVTGSVGGDLSRTVNSNFANALSVNAAGELVFTQPNSTTKAAIYSKCMLYITQVGYITMSCKLKNTGNTSGAAFYPYIAILDAATGKIKYRSNGTEQTATAAGAVITHKREVQAGDLVLCYIYHNTAVANSETTLSEYVAEYRPYEDGDSAVYKPYVGSSRTGDGTLYSVSGYNNILIDASSAAGATFTVDYLDNPLGSVPSASGVSF